MKAWLVVVTVLLWSATAAAREPDGSLGLIISPNNTQPQLVMPGGTFQVLLREPAQLQLESALGLTELDVSASSMWRGYVQMRATLPENLPGGTYALVARGTNSTDRNFRSVYVYEQIPEEYRIVQFNELQVNAAGGDTALYRSTRQIVAESPALVLVTGNLTEDGRAEQFRVALDVLNACNAPTLVAAGANDTARGLHSRYLGPLPYVREFGKDGYLMFIGDPSTPGVALDRQTTELYTLRRLIRASRWSVGVTGQFTPATDMRTQLTLLVDDPLDVVIASSANGHAGRTWWDGTPLYAPPSDVRRGIAWYTVEPRAIAPAR